MAYFVEDNGKIVMHDTDKARLEKTLAMCPKYKGYAIRELQGNIINGLIEGSDEYREAQSKAIKFKDIDNLGV
jgi:hypothetical protein